MAEQAAALPGSRHLLRARDLIDRRYAAPLTVPGLARAARCSPAHFSRGFTRAFGVPPHRYLLERRIERARYRLTTSDASILEIAVEVGFRRASAFCTAFRRVTGTTPGAYRRLASDVWRSEVPSCVLAAWTRPVLEVSTNAQSRPPASP
jgi:AraC-like DNA-binding protein